jgi:hypothetical protein
MNLFFLLKKKVVKDVFQSVLPAWLVDEQVWLTFFKESKLSAVNGCHLGVPIAAGPIRDDGLLYHHQHDCAR